MRITDSGRRPSGQWLTGQLPADTIRIPLLPAVSFQLAVDLAAGQVPELPDPQLGDPHQLTAGQLAAAAVEQCEPGGLAGVQAIVT